MTSHRDRALFGLCYFTASRISEVLELTVPDLVGNVIIFRTATTQCNATRQAEIHPTLERLLDSYIELPKSGYIFPGRWERERMTHQSAKLILRKACGNLSLTEVSTYSFRRSFVTHMNAEGHPPEQIRKYTGHKSLKSLLCHIGA